MSDNTEAIGLLICELRKRAGITQAAFAETISVTPQAVSKWETGISLPDVALLPEIAKALGVSVGTLFGEQNGEGVLPRERDGLALVGSRGKIGCYADRKPSEKNGDELLFADGSTANLESGVVMNRGVGKIMIFYAKDDGKVDLKAKRREFNLAPCLSVRVKTSGSTDVAIAYGESCRVAAEGCGAFTDALKCEARDGTLVIECPSINSDEYKNTKNRLEIALPCERGESAELELNGSGSIGVALGFESVGASINGSGIIKLRDADALRASVNGSGCISAEAVAEPDVQISGSGEVSIKKADSAGPAKVRISGSGDVALGDVSGSLEVDIRGSGSVRTGEVDVEYLKFSVGGSGDMTCYGTAERLAVNIRGGGDFDGEELFVREADIELAAGEAVIGRVSGFSREKIANDARLRVLSRER